MTTVAQPVIREPESRAATAGLDLARIRADFPILTERINGKPLVYLDNAATSQKPRVVLDAIANYYEHMNANIHRGVHTLSVRATEAHDAARLTVKEFINAADTREIIFVRGATEAINLVAQTYGRKHVGAGDEVLITAMEHHSNIVPWQILCEEKGAHLKVAPIDDRGELIFDEFAKLIVPRTKIVAVTQVSNALGTVLPLREMIELAHRQGVPVLVDGAQAVPHFAVDVQALDATSTPSAATRFTLQPESACSMASARCSTPCLLIRVAAT